MHHPQQPVPPPKKPSKALLAFGIGCGALLLIVGAIFIGGAFWVKSKVSGVVGGAEEVAKQEEKLGALNKKYPFTAPPENKPVRLTEPRLGDYLDIRASLVPIYEDLMEKGKKLDSKKESIGDGLKAIGMIGEYVVQVRAQFIAALEKKRMSPREFHAITATIYASYVGAGLAEGQREGLESGIARIDEQLASGSVTPEMRPVLQKQRADMANRLAEMKKAETGAELAVYQANRALLEKHEERVKELANPAFDVFILTEHAK